jgi:hypothetical protein
MYRTSSYPLFSIGSLRIRQGTGPILIGIRSTPGAAPKLRRIPWKRRPSHIDAALLPRRASIDHLSIPAGEPARRCECACARATRSGTLESERTDGWTGRRPRNAASRRAVLRPFGLGYRPDEILLRGCCMHADAQRNPPTFHGGRTSRSSCGDCF